MPFAKANRLFLCVRTRDRRLFSLELGARVSQIVRRQTLSATVPAAQLRIISKS